MRVRAAEAADIPLWAAMRHALWPDADRNELADELPAILADPARLWSFVIVDDADRVCGFIEAQLRDMFDGNRVDPFPFLEALWVESDVRRHGAARLLFEAVEARARAEGHVMIGSDADLDNADSHRWHEAVGFEEESRQILYGKRL